MKRKEPKISVIVCTYNREKLLAGCLHLLKKQKMKKNVFEVLIVDNNSTDNTREISKKLVEKSKNFKYFYEEKQGLSHARNLGAREASGTYIAYIDDDVRVTKDWLKIALRIIDTKAPDIFGGPVFPIFPNGKPEWYKDEYGVRGDMGETGWITKGYIIGANFFIKKSLLEEYGGFDPELGMKGTEIGYHEETKLVRRAFKEDKKVLYSKDLFVRDLLPEYKKSLAFFICSKYKVGFSSERDTRKLTKSEDFLDILNLINDTFNEMNRGLMNRDEDIYKSPENYIIEKALKNLPTIGKRIGFILKNQNNTK